MEESSTSNDMHTTDKVLSPKEVLQRFLADKTVEPGTSTSLPSNTVEATVSINDLNEGLNDNLITRRRSSTSTPHSEEKRRIRPKDHSYMLPEDGYRIRSSSLKHRCVLCKSVHKGVAGLSQHLFNVHKIPMFKSGMWIRCTGCGVEFHSAIPARQHSTKLGVECTMSDLEVRWKEKIEDDGNEVDCDLNAPTEENNGKDQRSNVEKKKRKRRKRTEMRGDGEHQEKKKRKKEWKEELNDEGLKRRHEQIIQARSYMQPRAGWRVERTGPDFKCRLCDERTTYRTMPSLIWHMRKQHATQLSHICSWIHCTGCDCDFASSTTMREHFRRAKSLNLPCSWNHALLSWQEKEGPSTVGVNPEPIDCGTVAEVLSIDRIAPKRKGTIRMKHDYMTEEEGYVIRRTNTHFNCKACESVRPSLVNLIYHMRNEHDLQLSDVGCWLQCECGEKFRSNSAYRLHVRLSENKCRIECSMLCWKEKIGEYEDQKIDIEGMQLERNLKEEEEVDHLFGAQPIKEEVPDPAGNSMCGYGTKEGTVVDANTGDTEGTSSSQTANVLGARVKEEMDDEGPSVYTLSNIDALSSPFESLPYSSPIRDCLGRTKRSNVGVNRDYMKIEAGDEVVVTKDRFECRVCGLICPTLPNLIWHMRKEHNVQLAQVGAWLLCQCGIEYTSYTTIREHMRKEGTCSIVNVSLGWKKSQKCEKNTYGAESTVESTVDKEDTVAGPSDIGVLIGDHMANDHSEVDSLNRKRRFKMVFDKNYMMPEEGFEIIRTNEVFECRVCQSFRPSLTNLIWHMRQDHDLQLSQSQLWMQCQCDKEITSATSLRVHLRESKGCSISEVRLCWKQPVICVKEEPEDDVKPDKEAIDGLIAPTLTTVSADGTVGQNDDDPTLMTVRQFLSTIQK